MTLLDLTTRHQLLSILGNLAILDGSNGRSVLLHGLPPALVNSIERHPAKSVDLAQIVDACDRWQPNPADPIPLHMLIANARQLAVGSRADTDLQRILMQIEGPPPIGRPPAPPIARRFRLDRANFPMIQVPEIDAYLHWIPVTKIQFEYFISATPGNKFDESWYNKVRELNPRIASQEITEKNYWKAFLTGITHEEVEEFARWCGDGYAIPTLAEWNHAYDALQKLEAYSDIAPLLQHMGDLRERTQTVLRALDKAGAAAFQKTQYPRKLAGQMLMRLGVMEWIRFEDQVPRWGGMGQTPAGFQGSLSNPDYKRPSLPNPNQERIPYYGFRLLWRPA